MLFYFLYLYSIVSLCYPTFSICIALSLCAILLSLSVWPCLSLLFYFLYLYIPVSLCYSTFSICISLSFCVILLSLSVYPCLSLLYYFLYLYIPVFLCYSTFSLCTSLSLCAILLSHSLLSDYTSRFLSRKLVSFPKKNCSEGNFPVTGWRKKLSQPSEN